MAVSALRSIAAAVFILTVLVGAIALAGFLAEHVPTLVAFIGVCALIVLVVTREEGRP